MLSYLCSTAIICTKAVKQLIIQWISQSDEQLSVLKTFVKSMKTWWRATCCLKYFPLNFSSRKYVDTASTGPLNHFAL